MNKIKSVQLLVEAVLALVGLFCFLQSDMKQYIFETRTATFLFALLWVSMFIHFVFLFLDYQSMASMKHDYQSLYSAAYSDSLAAIPNRFSCDTMIEKYIDRKLPLSVGCVVIDLSNLVDVNARYDHTTGNKLLKDFSQILTSSAVSLCFVGRNGGNKFLAIFEACTREDVALFLRRIDDRVKEHNAQEGAVPIEYKTGTALNADEQEEMITKLIALANRRVYEDGEDGES